MRHLAQSLADTFGATVSYPDANGARKVAKPRAEQQFFYFEVTDTFGGEANYCWVARYKVKASSFRGAVAKVSSERGYQGRIISDWDSGDCKRWNVSGACICMFGYWWDEETHKHYTVKEI